MFTATVGVDARRRVFVPVPFDPDDVWGPRPRHHLAGTVNGMGVRAVVEPFDDGLGILLGPAWRRDCGIAPGDVVSVELVPEGVQRGDLPPDVARALADEPEAGEFFDSLAQFYRNAYVRWIEATKRRPDERVRRISETVACGSGPLPTALVANPRPKGVDRRGSSVREGLRMQGCVALGGHCSEGTAPVIIVSGVIVMNPDREGVARERAQRMVDATREEPGNITYEYWAALDAPGRFHVFEEWESAAALDAHDAQPYTQEFLGGLGDLEISDIEVNRYEVAAKVRMF